VHVQGEVVGPSTASAEPAMPEPVGAGVVCRITATAHKHRRTSMDALADIPTLWAYNLIIAFRQAAHRFEYAASLALVVIEWHSVPPQLLGRLILSLGSFL
jgi:hypothetical protein